MAREYHVYVAIREQVIIVGIVGNAEWEVLVVCKRMYTMTCLFAKDQSVDLKMPPGKRYRKS